MIFFIDESWQTIGGTQIGSLGAVAFRAQDYNRFCRAFFAIKRDELGATEYTDSELKGQTALAKAAFRRHAMHGDSRWILTLDRVFGAMAAHGAVAFGISTANSAYTSLRSASSTSLSKPYKQLLYDFRAFLIREGEGHLGILTFDERDHRDDEKAACALTNFLVRTENSWGRYVLQVPHFGASAVSPGLQVADVISHLGPHRLAPAERPELSPYHQKVESLRYEWRSGTRLRRTVRSVT
ncbi:MAG: DUF3800 domain-containing protein [Thermoleophilia bacterium]